MGFSISHLLVVLVIIVLLFGTGKLRSLGTDLGSAIKGFRKAVTDDDANKDNPKDDAQPPAV
jgi:sec-independent protein translocase protein TatA